MLTIRKTDARFRDWSELLGLLQRSYAFMDERIDPPSSLHSFDAVNLEEKSKDEILYLAHDSAKLVGCIFGKVNQSSLYVGKLAVDPDYQGQGIGRVLMRELENQARSMELSEMTLEVRIELTENQKAFAAMGFEISKEGSHDGYAKVTFLEMKKQLGA